MKAALHNLLNFIVLLTLSILGLSSIQAGNILSGRNPEKNCISVLFQDKNKLVIGFSAPENNHTGCLSYACMIAIPHDAGVSARIVESKTRILRTSELLQIPVNRTVPYSPVTISPPGLIRGIDIVRLSFLPVQYDPETRDFIFYRELKVEIIFTGGKGEFGGKRLRSRWWDPLLGQILVNFSTLPRMKYDRTFIPGSRDEGAEYLIISPDGPEFQQWADTIRKFREEQGILTRVATLSEIGGNTPSLIEDYIDNAYNSWDIPPVAVLCLGDYGSEPSNSVTSPVWNSYCVSDNIFADVNGDDLPDVIMARIAAQNESQLETMVTKFLDYERNPPQDPNFYNHPAASCSFAPAGLSQLLTEPVAGFWETMEGKSTNRLNVGQLPLPASWSTAQFAQNFVDYFGPSGLGYIPATPGEVNCTWDASSQDIVDGINNGTFMLLHMGPASESGWTEPLFTTSDINSLENAGLPFIWSMGSLTGKFNSPVECFAEKIHRHQFVGVNAGALGIVAPSEITYSFTTFLYALGAFDNMWPGFLPEVGTFPQPPGIFPAWANAAGKYYLSQCTFPVSTNQKILTYHVFHYFGDAFSTVYSDMPQVPVVLHAAYLEPGAITFDITANQGSLIGLSVNGFLIAAATGTGAPMSIGIPPQYPPDTMLVTVTQQNYYRYNALVPVETLPGIHGIFFPEFRVSPNPFLDETSFWFHLPEKGSVDVRLFDITGSLVKKRSYDLPAGANRIVMNREDLPAGVFLCRLMTEGHSSRVVKIVCID